MDAVHHYLLLEGFILNEQERERVSLSHRFNSVERQK